MPSTLDDIFGEYETERLAQIDKDEAEYNKPENVARRKAKADREFRNGVEQGWWDEEGNPLLPLDDDDPDEEDDAEDGE